MSKFEIIIYINDSAKMMQNNFKSKEIYILQNVFLQALFRERHGVPDLTLNKKVCLVMI